MRDKVNRKVLVKLESIGISAMFRLYRYTKYHIYKIHFEKYYLKSWKNETRGRIQKVALWKKYYISFAEIELQEIHFRAPACPGWIWGIILLGLIHDKLCCLRSSIWSRLVMRLSGRHVLYGNITIAATSRTRNGLNRFIVSYQQHQEIKFSNIKYFIILLWCLTSVIIKKLTRPSVTLFVS